MGVTVLLFYVLILNFAFEPVVNVVIYIALVQLVENFVAVVFPEFECNIVNAASLILGVQFFTRLFSADGVNTARGDKNRQRFSHTDELSVFRDFFKYGKEVFVRSCRKVKAAKFIVYIEVNLFFISRQPVAVCSRRCKRLVIRFKGQLY